MCSSVSHAILPSLFLSMRLVICISISHVIPFHQLNSMWFGLGVISVGIFVHVWFILNVFISLLFLLNVMNVM